MGESLYGRHLHWRTFGEWPDLRHPRRFSEHILKLKLADEARSLERARISDKEFVKEFIRTRVGDGHTARTLAVLHSREQVRAFSFPQDCAIKATHTSGCVALRKAGSAIDMPRILGWFDLNYYFVGREPNYRNLKPKVIVEELLTEPGQDAPRDYKFFCFRGIPAFIQVDTDRFTGHKRNLYSPRWNELDCAMRFPRSVAPTPKPAGLDQMLFIARRLSEGFSFIRVDFFEVNGRVVVGELTNHPDGGGNVFTPEPADFRVATLFSEPGADIESLVASVCGPPRTSEPKEQREAACQAR